MRLVDETQMLQHNNFCWNVEKNKNKKPTIYLAQGNTMRWIVKMQNVELISSVRLSAMVLINDYGSNDFHRCVRVFCCWCIFACNWPHLTTAWPGATSWLWNVITSSLRPLTLHIGNGARLFVCFWDKLECVLHWIIPVNKNNINRDSSSDKREWELNLKEFWIWLLLYLA